MPYFSNQSLTQNNLPSVFFKVFVLKLSSYALWYIGYSRWKLSYTSHNLPEQKQPELYTIQEVL